MDGVGGIGGADAGTSAGVNAESSVAWSSGVDGAATETKVSSGVPQFMQRGVPAMFTDRQVLQVVVCTLVPPTRGSDGYP